MERWKNGKMERWKDGISTPFELLKTLERLMLSGKTEFRIIVMMLI